MKKLLTLLLASICCSFSSYSQNEGAIWLFGQGQGMNVKTCPPTAIQGAQTGLLDSTDNQEGTSCLSDKEGNLLLYCDGVAVYDGQHQLIANDLKGGRSSTQSCVILRMPKKTEVALIVTTDEFQDTLKNGATYSLYNMCTRTFIVKNTLLTPNSVEKIAVTHISGQSGYWILLHGYNNTFYPFRFDENGIHAAPAQTIGNDHSLTQGHPGDLPVSAQGQMKFNPNGDKLAVGVSNHPQSFVEVFDFNSTTGELSNPFVIRFGSGNNTFNAYYGVEFDPTGTMLYVADMYQSSIWKVNISSPDTNDILASRTLIISKPGSSFSSMQIAPDGKIYVHSNGIIGYINTNYTYVDSVFFVPFKRNQSLPTFVAGYIYEKDDMNCAATDIQEASSTFDPNTYYPVYTITGQYIGEYEYSTFHTNQTNLPSGLYLMKSTTSVKKFILQN